MSRKDDVPPDSAMLRAVEILANLALHVRETPVLPPPPIDGPVVLCSANCTLQLGRTTRADVERDLGRGETYPAAGWWTYALQSDDSRRLLSVIFRSDMLTGVELYLPKGKSAPVQPPQIEGRFQLVPGDVAIGTSLAALDIRYTPAVGGPGAVMYAQAFEIRFAGGLGYVMGNAGIAERLVLYAAS